MEVFFSGKNTSYIVKKERNYFFCVFFRHSEIEILRFEKLTAELFLFNFRKKTQSKNFIKIFFYILFVC